MNDQLDKLENSLNSLVAAYNALKEENESLKSQLADKTAAVELLEEETSATQRRIDTLIASVTANLPAQQ